MFISLIQGVPLDAKGNMMAHFGDYINLFSLVGGVAVLLLSYLHGLNYISLKTTGPVRIGLVIMQPFYTGSCTLACLFLPFFCFSKQISLANML